MDSSRPFDFALFDAEVRKQYGDEAVRTLNEGARFGEPGTYIRSSSEALNNAIGIGGIPRGRVIEIYGPESSGKTTLALDFCANAQKEDPNAFIFYQDSENALNPDYAAHLGIDLSRFRISQTNELEEGMNLVLKAAKFGAAVCVVDSIASLEFEKTLEEGDATDDRAGGVAKPLRAALKKLVKVCRETGTTVILINHLTFKVGQSWGNPETTPGGTGPKFYCSIRIDMRPYTDEYYVDKSSGEAYGIGARIKVVKNKVASPFKKCEFGIIFGEGIDATRDLVTVATAAGVLEKSGNWYKIGEQKFNGQKALTDAMREDPDLESRIREELHGAMKLAA